MPDSNTQARPLHLAVVRNLTSLTVSLSDLRSLAIVEPVVMRPGLLEDIGRFTSELCRLSHCPAGQVERLGSIIFSELLPARVAAVLDQSPPRELHLQLVEAVAGVAWELAFDGTRFLGTKFRLSRHILCDQAPSIPSWVALEEVCNVLLLCSESPSEQNNHRERVIAAFRSSSDISLTTADSAQVDRKDLRRLLEASDIVHCIGPRTELSALIGEMATLADPPRLLVCEHACDRYPDSDALDGAARLCTQASRAGL